MKRGETRDRCRRDIITESAGQTARVCKVLGKPVLEEEVPRVNDGEMMKGLMMGKVRRNLGEMVKMLAPWVASAVAVGTGVWLVVRRC